MVAAAGLFGLDHVYPRLGEDHVRSPFGLVMMGMMVVIDIFIDQPMNNHYFQRLETRFVYRVCWKRKDFCGGKTGNKYSHHQGDDDDHDDGNDDDNGNGDGDDDGDGANGPGVFFPLQCSTTG